MSTETLVSQDMAEIAADALEAGNAINDTLNAVRATTY